jgi:hypothetical protein
MSSLYGLWIVIDVFFRGGKVEGWASLMVVILFSAGMIMLALAVIAEYLLRGLDELRGRPHYVIDKLIGR